MRGPPVSIKYCDNIIIFKGGTVALPSTAFWIGVSDIGEEDSFTYLSDGTLVNFVCESSSAGRAGKTKKLEHTVFP